MSLVADRPASGAAPGTADRSSLEAFAWIATGAIAFVAVAAMLLLAEPIGDLIAPEPLDFFGDPLVAELVRPEHAELVRVAIAILAKGTKLAALPNTRTWADGPRKVAMTSILLTPVPITKDNLDVVIQAGWVSKDVVCRGVKPGGAKPCN